MATIPTGDLNNNKGQGNKLVVWCMSLVIHSDPTVVWESSEFQGGYRWVCGVWCRVGRDFKGSWRFWYRICVVFWCDNLWGVISLLGVWHVGVFLVSGNYYVGDWLGRAFRFEDIW